MTLLMNHPGLLHTGYVKSAGPRGVVIALSSALVVVARAALGLLRRSVMDWGTRPGASTNSSRLADPGPSPSCGGGCCYAIHAAAATGATSASGGADSHGVGPAPW